MLLNYFKIAWRNLQKNRVFSALNIVGLAAGLCCFAYVALWVHHETSYDSFNTNLSRIVRLVATIKTETGVEETATSSAPMAKSLQNDYAEVENTVRLRMREEIITHQNQQIVQPGILLTDASFFDVFSYRLIRGDKATALQEPFSLVLTTSAAKKYFGDADPIGQSLLLNMYDSNGRGALYKITGITPDPPKNAHFEYTMLASFKTVEVTHPELLTTDGWGDGSFYTYLLLKPGVDYKTFSNKIAHFYGKYIGDLFAIWKPIYSYSLQPLKDIHLRSNLQNEIAPTGSVKQVNTFALIGLIILLVAGINYTNLATAQSISRAKEVGVKKVIGAGKKQLLLQYLTESVVTALLALLFSLLLSLLVQPLFAQVSGKDLSLFDSPWLILFLLGVTVVLGLVAGLYPALVLSAYRPVTVLKGSLKSGNSGQTLRKALVVTQFTVTMILVTGIVIIQSQMSFIEKKDLGYDKDALLFLRVNGNQEVVSDYAAFKQALQNSPLISGIATSNSLIVGGLGSGGAETVDASGRPLQVNTARLRVDTAYFSVHGIPFVAGGNFVPQSANDSLRQIVLNQTAVKQFGWNDAEAIGKPFKMGSQKGVVTGVVKNFHFSTLEQLLEPLAVYPLDGHLSRITVKVDHRKISEAVTLLQGTWQKHFPSALFDYGFVSQQVAEQYKAQNRFAMLFFYASILSLIIASLGLYGLIGYTVLQKRKENGIRKVLGATASQIAASMSAGFIRLVVVACLIATPVAWFAMNNWLQGFAYRIDLSWWMFAFAALLVTIIALLSISVQAIKAALANPVKSLRTE